MCNAECALSVTCANAGGAHVDGGACGPCSFPAAQRKLRADLFAATTTCIANLGANSCGDAGGALAANACYLNAAAALQPSPATTNFCLGTVLAACPINDCATLLAPRSDPTVAAAAGCFADAGPSLGNCAPFDTCVAGAVN